MWSLRNHDDDASGEEDLNRDRPNHYGHNIIKTSKHDYYFARTLPWYPSGFE